MFSKTSAERKTQFTILFVGLIILLAVLVSRPKFTFRKLSIQHFNIEQLQHKISPFSEMYSYEQNFVYDIVRSIKPKKIVEIGVSKGGSSALLLSAIKDLPGSVVYSIDKAKHVYSKQDKTVGFLIDERFPELNHKWKLFTGVITAQVIHEIGGGIDLVLIDTVHVTPGELLDFLQVLPYLKTGAVIILHDIDLLHSSWGSSNGTRLNLEFSNNLLFYYLRGTKYLPLDGGTVFKNIGAVQLDSGQSRYYFDYFFPLGIHWEYMLPEDHIEILSRFFISHYGERLTKIFKQAIVENTIYLEHHKPHSDVIRLNQQYEQ